MNIATSWRIIFDVSSSQRLFSFPSRLGNAVLLAFGIPLLICLAPASASAQVTSSFTEPVQFSNVAASEPGVLQNVHVREGDRVKVGQILAELDNQVLQQSLEIASLRANSDAEVRSAQARFRIAQTKFDKLKPLFAAGHANASEVEKSQADYEAALADFDIAKQEAQEARLEVGRIRAQINQRTIRSPIDGLVTSIHFRPGEYISGNQPQVATVVRLDQLRARFYLLADEIESISKGQAINVLIGKSSQKQTTTAKARIEFVSPVTDPTSGTTRVDVLIDNSTQSFRSGVPCQWIGSSNQKRLSDQYPATSHRTGSMGDMP